jgi:glutaredoxin-like protein NrdH
MAKDWMKEKNIAFEDYDVSSDAKKREEMLGKTGQMAVPVISVEKDGKEEIIIGFDKNRLSQLLGVK